MSDDPVLAHLVSCVDQGMTISLTLFLGGNILSGRLVGGREWFTSAIGASKWTYGEGASEELRDAFRTAFTEFADEFPDPSAEENNPDGEEPDPPPFVHMIETVSLSPGNASRHFVGHWRGKISAVDGFMLGQYVSP